MPQSRFREHFKVIGAYSVTMCCYSAFQVYVEIIGQRRQRSDFQGSLYCCAIKSCNTKIPAGIEKQRYKEECKEKILITKLTL